MPESSCGENVKCDRYHGSLPVRTCVLRHRLRRVTGCRKCPQGEEREAAFGYLFPTDFATLANQAAAYVAAVFHHPSPDEPSGKEETTNEDDIA